MGFQGTVKCNIGASWSEGSSSSGAAWILRDSNGSVMLHSRRQYSGIGSNREAEFWVILWAVEGMRSTNQQNITFEADFEQARVVFLNPNRFPSLRSLSSTILALLSDLESWRFAHVNTSRNFPATRIAASVTRDNRTQSYVARGGPYWLSQTLNEEKRLG
ncbi:PREDICTED: uncharacterized protein LOC106331737 [Brassica oleracea var. oleracea]|uniref:uncharacterized protein LOC106331737 n=1 Tax=Brassica oleracea var. oleracea TaxID=109376 RepID=UPI0006A6AD9A|nr:PREDICTED: uncharacterized protein LOC106331737 [Brassica oleracea var. oleracea]